MNSYHLRLNRVSPNKIRGFLVLSVVDREELTEVVKDLHYHLFEVEEELEQF